ncbi:MAG: hypothetical protein ACRELE_00595, partial [Gemmatimonadales bacterium]
MRTSTEVLMSRMHRCTRPAVLASLFATVAAPHIVAQTPGTVPAERTTAREWYRDAGFGMFIHW